jgi:hypothetical protein
LLLLPSITEAFFEDLRPDEVCFALFWGVIKMTGDKMSERNHYIYDKSGV